MGFVIFGAMGLYLLISLGVVAWAISHAKKNGKSAKRWGWGAALVMFMIPCWDWIPTVATHQYYCAKDSGFWVYKTLDQWKAENPGVMETLIENKGAPSTRQGDMGNFTDTYFLNQRINMVVKEHRLLSLLSNHLLERELVDTKTTEVLARYTDYWSGGNPITEGLAGLKFWLHSERCRDSGAHNDAQFDELESKFTGRQK